MASGRNSQLSYISPTKIMTAQLYLQSSSSMHVNIHQAAGIPKAPMLTSSDTKPQPALRTEVNFHQRTRSSTAPVPTSPHMKRQPSTSTRINVHQPTRIPTAPVPASLHMKLHPPTSAHCNLYQSTRVSKAPAPNSTLPQDLIQKQRAENRRAIGKFEVKSNNSSGHTGEVDRKVSISSTSDTASRRSSHETQRSSQDNRRTRQASAPPSQSFPAARDMGLRAQEAHLDKMIKENFGLKLDIFFSREHNAKMEAKMEKLEKEKAQLEETNEMLSKELERRDEAALEVTAMVCKLEEQVEMLKSERPFNHGKAPLPTSSKTYPYLDTKTSSLQQIMLEPSYPPRSENFYSDEDEEDDILDHSSMSAPSSLLSLSSSPSVFGLAPRQRPSPRDPESSPSPSPPPAFSDPVFRQGVLPPTPESSPPSTLPLPSPSPSTATIAAADCPQPIKGLPSPKEAFFNTKLPRLIGAVRRSTSLRLKRKYGYKGRNKE